MAALVIGASDARILFRHLLINAIGPIIVQITFLVPNAIFTEAFLSFIGIGISAPMASWGSMAQDARQVLTMHPGQLLLPTLCICITIFSLNFLGVGIGDGVTRYHGAVGRAHQAPRHQLGDYGQHRQGDRATKA